MKKIEQIRIDRVHFVGTKVTQEMIDCRQGILQVSATAEVLHGQALTGVRVCEAQRAGRCGLSEQSTRHSEDGHGRRKRGHKVATRNAAHNGLFMGNVSSIIRSGPRGRQGLTFQRGQRAAEPAVSFLGDRLQLRVLTDNAGRGDRRHGRHGTASGRQFVHDNVAGKEQPDLRKFAWPASATAFIIDDATE